MDRSRSSLCNQNSSLTIPVSVGKPSLRLRLEAYYSLISPEVLVNGIEWREKFDLIYQKFGGSVSGETKLAHKLEKKYGNTVRLKVASPNSTCYNQKAKAVPTNNFDRPRSSLCNQNSSLTIPVSVGKPSLRLRLEAYYSLISPEVLVNGIEWREKFDLIYQKFGGSVSGETKLAHKLEKKYGNTVRLKVASPNSLCYNQQAKAIICVAKKIPIHDECFYELLPSQIGTRVLDLTCNDFDPVSILSMNTSSEVLLINPFIKNSPLLDNVAKFRSLLPDCDPQKLYISKNRPKVNLSSTSSSSRATLTSKQKHLPALTSLVAIFEHSGPLSLLYLIHKKRQRIRIMVRYVDCIRGTLTGFLLAFDKHMNMILRDVDEVYSSRVTKVLNGKGLSKAELELKRRECLTSGEGKVTGLRSSKAQQQVKIKRRYCKQMLVRGDNVVMIWKVGEEKRVSKRKL